MVCIQPSVPIATLPIILKTQDICTSLGSLCKLGCSLLHLKSAWVALSVRGILPPPFPQLSYFSLSSVSFIGLALDHSSSRMGRTIQDPCISYVQVISQCWGLTAHSSSTFSKSDHNAPLSRPMDYLVHSESLKPSMVLESL